MRGQSHVLRGQFRGDFHGLPRVERHTDWGGADALRVEVDLEAAATVLDRGEDGLPEVERPVGDAALGVSAERDARYRRALPQQHAERVAAVSGMHGGREASNRIVGPGAVDQLIRVRPQAELEMQALGRRFLADPLERGQIALPFPGGEADNRYVVAGHGEQIRVGENKIAVHHPPRQVVAQAQGEAEPVEPLGHQHAEIIAPERLVVEPGLVLHVAAEQARDAPYRVNRLLDPTGDAADFRRQVRGVLNAVRQFEYAVSHPGDIGAGDEQHRLILDLAGDQRQGLGLRREG